MTKSLSSYQMLIFYSSLKFNEALTKIHFLENLFEIINKEIEISRKGWIEFSQLEFKQLRKKNINKESLKNDLKLLENQHFKQIGYYIFDNSFNDLITPKLFINLNYFQDYDLFYIDKATKIESYYLVAIDKTIIQNDPISLVEKFESIFNEFNGKIGYIFQDADFYYDGISDLAWAYRNIPVKINSDDVSKWEEKGEKNCIIYFQQLKNIA